MACKITSDTVASFRKIGPNLASPTNTESLTSIGRSYAEKHRRKAWTVRIYPGNCKATKTEMVWARDKIGRPNQSNTREQSKAVEEGAGRKRAPSRSGPANPSLRLRPWHTTGRSGEN